MKGIELLALGLRLVGIYGLLKGIQFISIAIGSVRQYSMMSPDENFSLWYGIFGVSLLLYFLAALALIVFPVQIAKKLMPRSDEQAPLTHIGAQELQVVAFTILGIYVLSWAIPDLVSRAAFLWNTVRMDDFYGPTAFSERVISTCVSVLQVGIGLYLCFQSEGLSRILMMIRGLGYRGQKLE